MCLHYYRKKIVVVKRQETYKSSIILLRDKGFKYSCPIVRQDLNYYVQELGKELVRMIK